MEVSTSMKSPSCVKRANDEGWSWKILFWNWELELTCHQVGMAFWGRVTRHQLMSVGNTSEGTPKCRSQKYHQRLVSPSCFWVLMVHNRFLDTIRITIELQFGPAASHQSWETIATFGQAHFQKIPSPHLSILISPTFESFFVKKKWLKIGLANSGSERNHWNPSSRDPF